MCEYKSYTKVSMLFEHICIIRCGDIKTLASLLSIIDIRDLDDKTIETGMIYAMANNYIFVLDWLFAQNKIIMKEDILDSAIDSNHTQPLDWFMAHDLLKPEYFDGMVRYAFKASTEKKKMLNWFLVHGYNFDTDVYYEGIVEMLIYDFWEQGLNWLLENGFLTRLVKTYKTGSNRYLVNMAGNRKRKLEKWILEHSCY